MQKSKLIRELLKLHAIIENEANKIGWGAITFNIFLKDSIPLIKTLNIVRQRRKKYQLKRKEVNVCQLINISKQSAILPK